MLYGMMRHVRSLQATRLDDDKFNANIRRIEVACERLFDFLRDIEDNERKDAVLPNTVDLQIGPVAIDPAMTRKAEKARLFGRHPN